MTGPASYNTWLYAVVDDVEPVLLAGAIGVAGEPLRGLAHAGLAAVVGSVPRSDFDEPALQAHLEDLRWLEQAVRAHHRVIDTLSRAGRTLPLRFATIFGDDQRVETLLAEQHEEFLGALDRVAHHVEWGVKAYAGATPAEQSRLPSAPVPGAAPPQRPGTDYLLRRRAQREQRGKARDQARHDAARIHSTLASQSREATEHPPQSADATGSKDPMVLNGAYLVDRSRADDFAAAAAALADRYPELRLELTGPWPPYSFVDIAPDRTRSDQSPE